MCFVLLFGTLCWHKRSSIGKIFESSFRKIEISVNQPSEKVLSTFNNIPKKKSVRNEFIRADNANETVRILFLGNSITTHGKLADVLDYESGMAATNIEKDYVHQLCKMIAENKNINVDFSILSIADFERGFSQSQLENASVQSPDFVIFQIGENVSGEDITKNCDLLKQRYSELIENFADSKRIVTLPFWPDKDKINCITEVAMQTDSIIVDISHLGSGIDKENFASSQKNYKQLGVGEHPGDVGMKRIAECIYSAMF